MLLGLELLPESDATFFLEFGGFWKRILPETMFISCQKALTGYIYTVYIYIYIHNGS